MADLSEFNAIKLVKSLVARLEKGEHEGEETKEAFRADLDRYIAYEDEQVCQNQSGKLRQGKHKRALGPMIKARRMEQMPAEQRSLALHLSAEVQRLDYRNENSRVLQQLADSKRLEEKVSERDTLLRRLGRSTEEAARGPLQAVRQEIAALQEEVERGQKETEHAALLAKLGHQARPPPQDLKALRSDVRALRQEVTYAAKVKERAALQGDLGLCVEPPPQKAQTPLKELQKQVSDLQALKAAMELRDALLTKLGRSNCQTPHAQLPDVRAEIDGLRQEVQAFEAAGKAREKAEREEQSKVRNELAKEKAGPAQKKPRTASAAAARASTKPASAEAGGASTAEAGTPRAAILSRPGKRQDQLAARQREWVAKCRGCAVCGRQYTNCLDQENTPSDYAALGRMIRYHDSGHIRSRKRNAGEVGHGQRATVHVFENDPPEADEKQFASADAMEGGMPSASAATGSHNGALVHVRKETVASEEAVEEEGSESSEEDEGDLAKARALVPLSLI